MHRQRFADNADKPAARLQTSENLHDVPKECQRKDLGDKVPAPELDDVWIVFHNVNTITTLGVAAVHDDALIHV